MMIKLRAAVYVRVASAKHHGDLKLIAQEEIVRQWARQNRCQVVRSYADIGSGNTEERPGLQQLMADAQAGVFDVVIVLNWSRLFRKLELLQRYCGLLRDEHNVTVIAICEGGWAS